VKLALKETISKEEMEKQTIDSVCGINIKLIGSNKECKSCYFFDKNTDQCNAGEWHKEKCSFGQESKSWVLA